MEPLRLGLYGCGARTNALVDAAYQEGLVGVCCCYDVDEGRRRETARKYDALAVGSSRRLIAEDEVDAFVISLPPRLHASAALETLRAGKPIFLEKPIATNLEDGRKLVKAVKEAGVVCQVGLAQRYVPVFRKVTEIIRSGALGRIIGIHNHWISYAGTEGPLMSDSGNWRGDPRTGGELFYHYCHFFDLLRVWGGEFVSVTATSNHLIFPKCPGENEILMTLQYESGALAGLHFSEVSRHSDMIGRIEGSEATLEYAWNENSFIKLYRETKHHNREPDEVLEGFDPGVSDREIMSAFLRAARGEAPPPVTIEDGFVPLQVAVAARESARTGRRVQLSEFAP